MNKKLIIVIGGGVAGLVAARQLCNRYDVILLEALPRFGGRMHTLNDINFPSIVEAGAEFVHGAADETIKLLNEAGITIQKVQGEFYRNNNGVLEKEEGQVEGWDLLMKKMSEVNQDLTLQAFLDLHFNGSQFKRLRDQAITFANGFDLADKGTVSVKSLYQEWSHQSDDHRIDGGYGKLVDFLVADCLKKGCKLIKDSIVKEINWSEGNVQVHTIDKALYVADKCLITIPFGVLKQSSGQFSLNFQPDIAHYLHAINQIGFGTVIKIVLNFSEIFWQQDAGFFFSEEEIPTWWTQLPAQVPVLTGWCGGTKGSALSQLSDDRLLELALESLSAIFNLNRKTLNEKLVGFRVFNWQKQVASLGAYSYSTVASAKAIELLNTPIENTLYFAGEGLYNGLHPGTVEAAIVTAHSIAKQLS